LVANVNKKVPNKNALGLFYVTFFTFYFFSFVVPVALVPATLPDLNVDEIYLLF